MPMYEVFHVIPLTPSQQGQLAEAITRIHAHRFNTPSLFVNVRFKEVAEEAYYIAGKKQRVNRVIANVRHGPSRSQDDYDAVGKAVEEAWLTIVGGIDFDAKEHDGSLRQDQSKKIKEMAAHNRLTTVFFYGSIVAGREKGFSIPQAGKDKEWVRENLDAFKHQATLGDDDFGDMLKELQERDDFKGVLPADFEHGNKSKSSSDKEGTANGPSQTQEETANAHARDTKLGQAAQSVTQETGASDESQVSENMPTRPAA